MYAIRSYYASAGITSLISISYSLIGAFIILPPVLDYRFKSIKEDNFTPTNPRDRVLRHYKNMVAYPRRITSYNVCYTKLLRIGTIEFPPLWSLGFQQCRYSYYPDSRVKEIADTFRLKKIVITSYSIHYTKLYDSLLD